jgi:small-conductance mechanosensitive channel
MIRLLAAWLLALSVALPVHAATTLPPGPPPAPPPAPAPGITADQAKAALDMLNDPQKRAAFQATLEAIVAAKSTPAPANPAATASGLEPGSVGAILLYRTNAAMINLRHRIADAATQVSSVPRLWNWVVVMTTDPVGQEILWNVGWRLLVAIWASGGAWWLTRYLLRSTARRLDKAARAEGENPVDRAELGDTEAVGEPGRVRAPFGRHPWITATRLSIRLLPILALVAGGHVAALVVDSNSAGGLVIEAVLEAATATMLTMAIADIVLSPRDKLLRPISMSDAAASYLMRWMRRLMITASTGYAIAEASVLLGLSDQGHDAILTATNLLLTAGLFAMILRLRRRVRRVLRPADSASGVIARMRQGIAAIWHWLAFAGLGLLWLSWAVDISVLGEDVVTTLLSILAVIVATKIAIALALSLVARLPAMGRGADARYPGLQERVDFYHPALIAGVKGVIYLMAGLAILHILGSGSLRWLVGTPGGQRLMSGILALAVTILTAIVIWELVNTAIERHLVRLQQDAQFARSVRLRTLLPVLRTALLIAIGIVTVLMVLSQIGVDIAPLLAGAGIMGVAIGFGSQKLVQDLITGIFLLLENALQVGDLVNVAGLSGKVEGLSIRTIRLRAVDGALHIVPFSAVTAVTNNSRGVGNADVRATVDFATDTDKAAEIMASIVSEMRSEPAFEGKILQDFSLWGVDKIDSSGVTIVGQVACTDSGRWSVQREINRRMKRRFEAAGIQFFAPPPSVSVVIPHTG